MDYRIQPGDTLTAIAARFAVPLLALESANPQVVDPDLIFPNDIVHIPGPHGQNAAGGHSGPSAPNQLTPVPPHLVTYVVQPGDTLSGIAAAHCLSLVALEAANPQIANPALIRPGQIVNLTGATSTQSRRTGTAGTTAAAAIAVDRVTYSLYTEDGDVASWTSAACGALGVPAGHWVTGYETLCRRESSGRANAINAWDTNAHGPLQADGYPLHCSRGVAQCIPDTFAAHHAPHTSTSIYDPVANIAASINYVIGRYGVADDASNLAGRVQQADPNRSPMGY